MSWVMKRVDAVVGVGQAPLGLQVLDQGATEKDIQELEAAADAPDGLPALDKEAAQSPLYAVPPEVGLPAAPPVLLAVAGRGDVHPSGEEEPLGQVRQTRKVLRLTGGDREGEAPAGRHRVGVILIEVEIGEARRTHPHSGRQ